MFRTHENLAVWNNLLKSVIERKDEEETRNQLETDTLQNGGVSSLSPVVVVRPTCRFWTSRETDSGNTKKWKE